MYEERSNGSHVMKCDTPDCNHELLSESKESLVHDVALAGWEKAGNSESGEELFVCGRCTHESPMATALKGMLDGDTLPMQAPAPVSKGDPVFGPDGTKIGEFAADAEQGEQVDIKLEFPEPEKPTSAVERFDEMLEGTDADDDGLGRKSAVAPSDPTATGPAIQHRDATAEIDHAGFAATEAMFNSINTSWDPDASK